MLEDDDYAEKVVKWQTDYFDTRAKNQAKFKAHGEDDEVNMLAAPLDRVYFTRLVLGCIEAKFCK